jgi:DNA modification methylase
LANRIINKEIEQVAIDLLKHHPRNANHGDVDAIKKSLAVNGWYGSVVVNTATKHILAGNHRVMAAKALGWETVPVQWVDVTPEEELRILVVDNRTTRIGQDDTTKITDILAELANTPIGLDGTGYSAVDLDALIDSLTGTGEPEELLTDPDEVPEVVETRCQPGDLWILGNHRLLCGDSTKVDDVERLMDGATASLIHADPPYGMGKEKDGVENDNLYADKLDRFQMDWFRAFRRVLSDNGSVYIWGNAEDLWRLWFVGGLKDIERLTFRNEVVWQKNQAQGRMSDKHRQYPTGSERCLFFMIGEQGFNNNADNYWEGWEPIRKYLADERDALGWNNKIVANFFGFHPRMADHWFSQSQWSFITEEQYKRLQTEAKGNGFKREYDELKREFYSTRAYFDNTHDNMTDVWEYPGVMGDERLGHATPKPVAMIERCIKSSSEADGIVIEPFLGSGTTLIAAEKTNRKCYGMEISPKYCDVIIQRWENATGKKAVLDGTTNQV